MFIDPSGDAPICTKFETAFDKCTSNGWLTKPEAALLYSTALACTGRIVEVGCYMGRSTTLLAQLGRPMHCVDPWDDSFSSDMTGTQIMQKWLENVAPYLDHITAHRMRIEDWHPIPAGFVYLDGDHTFEGTKTQIRKAMLCKPQAIAIHDVNDSGEGELVKIAALELLGGWSMRVERLAVWWIG